MSVQIDIVTGAPRASLSVGASQGGTTDHRELSRRDAEDQHPIGAITGLAEALRAVEIPTASETVLGGVRVGSNLKIDEDGVLSVDTAVAVEEDNTRPVTSAAVHMELGNVEVLLAAL